MPEIHLRPMSATTFGECPVASPPPPRGAIRPGPPPERWRAPPKWLGAVLPATIAGVSVGLVALVLGLAVGKHVAPAPTPSVAAARDWGKIDEEHSLGLLIQSSLNVEDLAEMLTAAHQMRDGQEPIEALYRKAIAAGGQVVERRGRTVDLQSLSNRDRLDRLNEGSTIWRTASLRIRERNWTSGLPRESFGEIRLSTHWVRNGSTYIFDEYGRLAKRERWVDGELRGIEGYDAANE